MGYQTGSTVTDTPYPDERLSIWYHGTNADNAATILAEGFRTGTYLAQGLADALGFGGEYIFEVAVPAAWRSRAGRQMTITEPLPPPTIVGHYRLQKTPIFENEELRTHVFESNEP